MISTSSGHHFNAKQFLIIMGVVILGFIVIIFLFCCFFCYYGEYIKEQIKKEADRRQADDEEYDRRLTVVSRMSQREASGPGYIGVSNQDACDSDSKDSEVTLIYHSSNQEGHSAPVESGQILMNLPRMDYNVQTNSNSEAMYGPIGDGNASTMNTTDGSIQTLQPLSSEIHHLFNPSNPSQQAESESADSSDEIYDDPDLRMAQISSTALSNIVKKMEDDVKGVVEAHENRQEMHKKASLALQAVSSTAL